MDKRVPRIDSKAVQNFVATRVGREEAPLQSSEIDYQPASRYRPFWPDMEAFALPSFYDGRLRVNLLGRERYGAVSLEGYPQRIAAIKLLLEECVDLTTAAPVVDGFHEPPGPALERGTTESDLYIFWRGLPVGIAHPILGTIGPIPYRRTGGHSGPWGFLYACGCGLGAGHHGTVSSFDVLPTIAAFLGENLATLDICGTPVPGWGLGGSIGIQRHAD